MPNGQVSLIAPSVKQDILGLQNDAFKRGVVAESVLATVLLQRKAMQRRDVRDRQKTGSSLIG